DVVIITESGRGVRWPLSGIPLSGVQAINPGRDESFDRVTLGLATSPSAEIVLLLADGFARRMKSDRVPEPEMPNAKGRALVARASTAVGLAPSGEMEIMTNRRLVTADSDSLPLEESTKTARLVKMSVGETVTAAVSGGKARGN